MVEALHVSSKSQEYFIVQYIIVFSFFTVVCPVGRKLESGTCVLCPVGQYQNETGSTICKTCPEFKTTASVGSTSSNQCVYQCEAGTYVDESVYGCVDCPVDTYQDQVSQPSCIHCPGNNQTKSTRSTGSHFCHTPCPEGQEFDTQDSTCKLCPVNYYKDAQPSSRVCIKCPQGQKSLTRGSTGCVPLTSGGAMVTASVLIMILTLFAMLFK
ncbi:sushi, von Willebrand factor type A, EGF and pentraxin domain-containing protein 1-like [Gigantopelta aegis]|uniref:sushi, von Willebrand factor type A, EGF and pentraxin domain-containing protein 1-like n=1 Tax=Gigantopelta aegis TaxID=1735272 RepID=UPI001B88E6BE|nr:sushi, von Willebrand factor type A, EGF and pentraxin domain-containing protein 1-like [Gigantopelta aegis]